MKNHSIFLFSRLIQDEGDVRQIIGVYAPDIAAARALRDNFLRQTAASSRQGMLEYRLDPPFVEGEVELKGEPQLIGAWFTHLA